MNLTIFEYMLPTADGKPLANLYFETMLPAKIVKFLTIREGRLCCLVDFDSPNDSQTVEIVAMEVQSDLRNFSTINPIVFATQFEYLGTYEGVHYFARIKDSLAKLLF